MELIQLIFLHGEKSFLNDNEAKDNYVQFLNINK